MSAWVIALGLSAGYLMNKQARMSHLIQQKAKAYEAPPPQPANPGPQTAEIRQVQRTVPAADRYESLNLQDLSQQDVRNITQAKRAAADEVQAYESQALPPIEGVYLVRERGF